MNTTLRSTIDPEVEILFDPLYEGLLHRSMLFDEGKVGKINNILMEYSGLPNNLSRLCEALADDNSNAMDIAELIHFNPSLAGKVLKLVNSGYYGLQGKISNLKRAVALLGFDIVHSLLIGANAYTTIRVGMLPADMPLSALWNHSIAVSQLAGYIGNEVGGVDSSMLISAGLLHDAGKLLLNALSPTNFLRAVKSAEEVNGDLIASELKTLGVSHPVLGAALAIKWNLPKRLWQVILFQQHPSIAQDRKATAVLMLGEYFARSYEVGRDGQPPWGFPPEDALKELGMSYEEAKDFVSPDRMQEIIEHTRAIAEFE